MYLLFTFRVDASIGMGAGSSAKKFEIDSMCAMYITSTREDMELDYNYGYMPTA